MKKYAGSAYWRVTFMCVLAFAVYGGWAFWVNLGYGLEVALTAGLAQGVSSTISTLIISAVIEYCFERFRHRRGGLFLAWVIPPTLTGLMHAAFQWVVGTPQIFITVLFSVFMGYLFGAVYVRGLIRLTRALAEPATER
jgi:hypothetical protein